MYELHRTFNQYRFDDETEKGRFVHCPCRRDAHYVIAISFWEQENDRGVEEVSANVNES